MWTPVWCLPQRLRRPSQNGKKDIKRKCAEFYQCIFFWYLLLMMQRPYIGCYGFQPLWAVNASVVTLLPSNGVLMGPNGLPVQFCNRLGCLLVLNGPMSPSGVTDPFIRQCNFVMVASSKICMSVSTISCPSASTVVTTRHDDHRR